MRLNTQIDMFYVTDRLPDPEKKQLEYGTKRSDSVGFGSTLIDIGNGLSWDQLMEVSESGSGGRSLDMTVRERTELGRFPPTPHPFSVIAGRPVEAPETLKEFNKTSEMFRAEINRRLILTERKDIIIYVHGFNNTFDEAAANLAGVWHFMGRQGVPLVYTWPAAHGGLFGYFIDRESGEFTIFHLKEILKLLASFSEIENIHIIAHSRGTDITTSALRELIIESRGAGKNPRESLRIKNLILAAPDLDFGVMRQRLIAEKFGVAFGQITVYTAQTDTALNISEFIMTGLRLGHLESKNFSDTEKEIFSSVKNVNFIDVIDVRSFISHSYYLDSPFASSDLIRVLLNSSKPGSTDRPLTHKQNNFWEIPPDYPNIVPDQ
jgi:esterase/lipase superfamily enzyme